MTRRGGIIKMEEDGVENVWAKTPSRHAFSKYFLYCHIISFFPFPFPFLNNPGNDSLWFLFLKHGNGFCSFPSCSRNLGWDFFIPFPFPNFGNVFFSFPSCSRILRMGFVYSRTSGIRSSDLKKIIIREWYWSAFAIYAIFWIARRNTTDLGISWRCNFIKTRPKWAR